MRKQGSKHHIDGLLMLLMFGLPLLGWVVTLFAMRFCSLSKEEMAEVQERIAAKKADARNNM